MAQVIHYVPEIRQKLICSKGSLHQEQSISMVCLDPLCREDPLACSVCFAQIHKHHKVVTLDKFVSDYLRNIKTFSKPSLNRKIVRQHSLVKDHIALFRANMLSEFDKFQENIDYYAQYLQGHLGLRKEIARLIGTKLEPDQIKKTGNFFELSNSIRFILNNSLFDENRNMINVSEILKQDRDKVYALLDKMVNMTQQCQRSIIDALDSLNFAQKTIQNQKRRFNENVKIAYDSNVDPFSIAQYMKTKKQLETLFDDTVQTHFQTNKKWKMDKTRSSTNRKDLSAETRVNRTLGELSKSMDPYQIDRSQPNAGLGEKEFELKFSKYRHSALSLRNNGYNVISKVSALKPQFAVISPHLNLQPQSVRQWDLKIVNCRNFASANTMGVGIGTLSSLKLACYEKEPTNTLLVTSQGYSILNGKVEKTDFVYGAGDVLHFRYDPFYGLLEIEKRNGRKLTLKAVPSEREPLYICVRLTYASDQVQIV